MGRLSDSQVRTRWRYRANTDLGGKKRLKGYRAAMKSQNPLKIFLATYTGPLSDPSLRAAR